MKFDVAIVLAATGLLACGVSALPLGPWSSTTAASDGSTIETPNFDVGEAAPTFSAPPRPTLSQLLASRSPTEAQVNAEMVLMATTNTATGIPAMSDAPREPHALPTALAKHHVRHETWVLPDDDPMGVQTIPGEQTPAITYDPVAAPSGESRQPDALDAAFEKHPIAQQTWIPRRDEPSALQHIEEAPVATLAVERRDSTKTTTQLNSSSTLSQAADELGELMTGDLETAAAASAHGDTVAPSDKGIPPHPSARVICADKSSFGWCRRWLQPGVGFVKCTKKMRLGRCPGNQWVRDETQPPPDTASRRASPWVSEKDDWRWI